MFTVSAPSLLVDGRITGPGIVTVDDGRIAEVALTPAGDGANPAAGHWDGTRPADIVLASGLLTAGLVDIQVNGAFGVDFADAGPGDWEWVAARLSPTGVTALQPTLITAGLAELAAGAARVALAREELAGHDALPRIIGAHLEGPFLSPRRPGVHDPALMQLPTPEAIGTLLDALAPGSVTTLTLAPELPGALEAISRLTAAGISVSAGHTDGLAADLTAAADAGATMVTHLFNAQRPLNHREPGVAGQALVEERLTLGLIADLRHVAPAVCQLIFRAAAGRVALVTDAVAAAGMPPGSYELGGQQFTISERDPLPRRADGTIAGSALLLDTAVRNLIGLGIDPAVVLDAASRVPADAVKRPDLGRIAPGALADLVWWSADFTPQRCWIGGVVAYDAQDAPSAADIS